MFAWIALPDIFPLVYSMRVSAYISGIAQYTWVVNNKKLCIMWVNHLHYATDILHKCLNLAM